MNYQNYSRDFLTDLRNESMLNASDTEDEFVSRVLDILTDFDEIHTSFQVSWKGLQ